MRKILTQDEIIQRDKKRSRIISMVLLIIMVFSLAAGAFVYSTDGSNQNTDQVSEGKIQNYGDRWVALFGGVTFNFAYSPETVFNVTKLNFIPDASKYSQKPLYIDSQSEAIYSEIALNLGAISQRYQYACFDNCENSTYAQKTCEDNLIVYRPGNENIITQNASCIFIDGDMRGVDAFLYREIGIA